MPSSRNAADIDYVHYRTGDAPFDELSLVRADQAINGSARDQIIGLENVARVVPPYITKDAWMESDWLSDDLRSNPDAFAQFKADDPHKQPYGKALATVMVQAALSSTNRTGWLAVKPPKDDRRRSSNYRGLGMYLLPSEVAGFSDGRVDISGNAVQRMVKRVRYPEKVYATVSNVNVLNERQVKYIGTALFYAALGSLPPKKRATVYASTSAEGVIGKLEELGYEVTGSQPRDDLVTNATIEEVRLQANSVTEVRHLLKEKYGWLK